MQDNQKPPPLEEKPLLGETTKEERTWAMLSHISILFALVLLPLIVMLVQKDKSSFAEDQAKEALNFHLVVLIAFMVCSATCILSPLAIVVWIGAIVYGVIAGIEANKGVVYRYPYTIRMIT